MVAPFLQHVRRCSRWVPRVVAQERTPSCCNLKNIAKLSQALGGQVRMVECDVGQRYRKSGRDGCDQPYGCRDFDVEDCNGYRLCFGQDIEGR